MASYDLKAILGEKIKRLTDKTLRALVDCMCTVGASLCSLDKRVSALESVELPEGGYKPMQEPVSSPSASGTAVQFIESVSQDATGRMTATKKTVRTGSTSQTGVLQLEDSHTSTSTSKAATPKNVKEAYDLANSKQSPATTIAGYGITDAYTKTEVDTFLAAKAEQVNVTNYTSFSDISAVVSAGNIPYYYHAVGRGAAKLYYQGTNVSGGIPPTVSQVYAGVFNGVLYETRFVNGASAFSAVVETPLFSAERVASSSESSSWSLDDTNVPTRAAVESKISSAMSGDIGGFLGSWTPIGVQYYQMANDFKKGDWVSITEAGTVAYYKNNDRSQSYTTFAVNAGDDIYWTTSGEFQKKASTSLQIYPISNLEDWNSLTNTGLYQIASQASNVQNSPSTGRMTLYVTKSTTASTGRFFVTQLAIGNHVYRRTKAYKRTESDVDIYEWSAWSIIDGDVTYKLSGSSDVGFNEMKDVFAKTGNIAILVGETIGNYTYLERFPLTDVEYSNGSITEFVFSRTRYHDDGTPSTAGTVYYYKLLTGGWVSGSYTVGYARKAGSLNMSASEGSDVRPVYFTAGGAPSVCGARFPYLVDSSGNYSSTQIKMYVGNTLGTDSNTLYFV